MRNVLKRILEFMSFLTAIFSFWDMVDLVFNICNELRTSDFYEPDSETLTSDIR